MSTRRERQEWERQPRETPQAFEAFAIYRDLGSARSVRKVGAQLGKTETLMSRWSSRWHWVRRARAYDEHLQAIALVDRDEDIRRAREQNLELARVAKAKVVARLNALRTDEIQVGQLANLVKMCVELELNSLGVPSVVTRTELTGPDAQPLMPPALVGALQDPQVREMLDQAARRIQALAEEG